MQGPRETAAGASPMPPQRPGRAHAKWLPAAGASAVAAALGRACARQRRRAQLHLRASAPQRPGCILAGLLRVSTAVAWLCLPVCVAAAGRGAPRAGEAHLPGGHPLARERREGRRKERERGEKTEEISEKGEGKREDKSSCSARFFLSADGINRLLFISGGASVRC